MEQNKENKNNKIACVLEHERKEQNGKLFDNLILTTPKGVKIQIKLAFYNRKLMYKLLCEIDNISENK